MNYRMAFLLLAGAVGCVHTPTEKDLKGAQIRYDLGIQAQQAGEVQGALSEFQEALKLDPGFPEAHNAIAILLHLAFDRPEEAISHYREALKIKPDFSEAKTNLANVFLEQRRYDEAIALYEEALNDMLYATPFIAQGNLGWALYKQGQTKRGIDYIKAAVTTNPKFCLGFKNLGIISDEQKNLTESCKNFGLYREQCPEVADAYFREGMCLARQGNKDLAKERFTACQAKATARALKDDCKLYVERLQ